MAERSIRMGILIFIFFVVVFILMATMPSERPFWSEGRRPKGVNNLTSPLPPGVTFSDGRYWKEGNPLRSRKVDIRKILRGY